MMEIVFFKIIKDELVQSGMNQKLDNRQSIIVQHLKVNFYALIIVQHLIFNIEKLH